MAEIDSKKVLRPGVELMSIGDYIKQYCPGVTIQGIGYAMDDDKIDFVRICGKDRMVVMTDKTRTYVPNANKKRKEKLSL